MITIFIKKSVGSLGFHISAHSASLPDQSARSLNFRVGGDGGYFGGVADDVVGAGFA